MLQALSELPWLQWLAVIIAFAGSASYLLMKGLFVLIVRDFARRFSLTFFGVWLVDRTIGRVFPDKVWSGRWRITWTVKSADFAAQNVWEGYIYRSFDTIAAKGAGHTSDGQTILYGFIGKLSRSDTILTGTWFDTRGTRAGYHGTYQVLLSELGTVASGKWMGFSGKRRLVRANNLVWEKLTV